MRRALRKEVFRNGLCNVLWRKSRIGPEHRLGKSTNLLRIDPLDQFVELLPETIEPLRLGALHTGAALPCGGHEETASMQTVITKADVKRALDNCISEHAMAAGKGGLPPDAYALGQTYAAMLHRRLECLPSGEVSQEAIAALARWKDHSPCRRH